MWRLKLKLPSGNQFMGRMAIKHKVSISGYPLSYWKEKKELYLLAAGFLFGEEENKKALMKDVKKQPEYVESEQNGDFIVIISKQPKFTEAVYNPRIIRPSPVIINKDGFHIWDLASFDRKLLEQVLKFAEQKLDGKVLSFRQEKLKNITFLKLIPELTNNQKRALELAIESGYYNYPKKITLPEISKKMGISYSTYQAHLKKAEAKILVSQK